MLGMKIISPKEKKSVLQLESHSATCGSQTQHRHEVQLPFFSWKTQLGWYTETSYRAHHLTFCFISLNLGWQWQISSTICMQGRWCTWVSKARSTFYVILQLSGDVAQTENYDPSKISREDHSPVVKDKNSIPLAPTVKWHLGKKGHLGNILWRRWE